MKEKTHLSFQKQFIRVQQSVIDYRYGKSKSHTKSKIKNKRKINNKCKTWATGLLYWGPLGSKEQLRVNRNGPIFEPRGA